MANVTLKIAPEEDPLGTPIETWDDNDILDLKLDISLYDLGRNTVRIPRKTWEASSLKAHTDGTYYVRVDIPYIDGSTVFWGFWLVSGEFVLTDPNEQGGEDVTIGGPGPMWYLTKARLNYREYSSHANIYVEDERWHFDGLTYGGILDALVDEDQASPRQALPDLDTPGWGAVNDADGNPWEDFPGIFSVDMGTDYLSVLRELQKADHLYAWMTPGEFNLRAVKQYGDDHSGAAFGAGVVRFEKGVNIVGQLRRLSEKGPLYTHVLAIGNDKVLSNGHVVEGQPIHVWVVSDDWTEGDPIRQGFLSYDTNSEDVLERRAKRFIRRSKDRSESLVRFEIMPGDDEAAGLYLPGRPSSVLGKFWIGDTITIDTGGGNDLDFNERDIAIAKIGVQLGTAVREDTDQGSERSWRVFIETGDDVRPSASADSAASTGAQTVRRCRCRRFVPFCTPIPDDAVETSLSNTEDDAADWPGSTDTGNTCWGADTYILMNGAGGSSSTQSVSAGDLVYGRVELRNLTGGDPWAMTDNYAYQAWLEFGGPGEPLIQHEIIHSLFPGAGCMNEIRDTVHEVPTGYTTARIKFRYKLGSWRYRAEIGTLTTEEGIDCPPFSYDDSLPHDSPYAVPSDTIEYLLENHTHEQGVIEDSFTNETDTSLRLAPDGAGGVEFVAGGGGYTNEEAQDAVGAMLADTATVNLTYTDATPELKADVIPGGIKLDDLAAPDDNTDLDASTGAHGLLRKLSGSTSDFLRADGSWATPSGSGTGNVETGGSAVVIPDLLNHPGAAGVGGGGIDEEYDTATTGLTWSSAPTTVDSDTTIPNALYVAHAFGGAGEILGLRAWSPGASVAFDARTHTAIVLNDSTQSWGQGLIVTSSGDTSRALVQITRARTSLSVAAFTYAGGSYTQRGSSVTQAPTELYLRITRDGSNNVSFWWSETGYLWYFIFTQSFTFTPANIGYRVSGSGAVTGRSQSNFLRTDV